ncbi:MAG: ABC transporter ATP-binding protein/permease [candidate division Zixibacteria bacterium]|nr:ABC transporter ATP-binding protein/permease [candidate division Zixibacteria bacterium]
MNSDLYENEQVTARERDISSRTAFGRLLPLLKRHKRAMSLCFFLLVAAQVLSLYWPKLVKDAVDGEIKNGDFNGLLWLVLIVALMQLSTIVFQYLQRVRLQIIGQDVMVELKSKLFSHILSLDVSFFDKNPVGRLLARVESDTEALRAFFTNTVIILVGDVLLMCGIFVVMSYYCWQLTLMIFGTVPVVVGMIIVFERYTTPRFLAVRKKMAEVTAAITELLHGMSIIQIFHRGAYARSKVNHANYQKFKDDSFANIAVCVFFNGVFFVQYVMVALVLFFGLLWRSEGMITTGTVLMFLILIWKMFEPIWRVSEQLSTIQKAIAGSKRIFALLSQKSSLAVTAHPVCWPRLETEIRFEKVWFSYTGDGDWVLKDVDFEIPIGRRYALAGVTGGGKTTVISLLLRYYDPQKGRITVDGVDIRRIPLEQLRARFALVLQDIFLFPGDVRSNIVLESEHITDETVVSAARMVDAHRFIGRLPDGYRTEVSEQGANFSRGERQLLSFARALAANPDVLLLDEATSSVDPETERAIQASLKRLMAGRTSLVIAHRLSTILDVDQILVIRRGEIIERGTHTELILQDGYYSKLFHLQFKNRNGAMANVR